MNKLSKSSHFFDRDEFLTPFDRIFDQIFASESPGFSRDFGSDFFQKGSYPRVNVVEYKDTVCIEAEIPGLSKDDVSVEIQENVLTIIGNKSAQCQSTESDRGVYILRELKRSSFKRSFTLNDNIDKSSVDAKFNNGILTVVLNKVIPTAPTIRKIEIK